jgi:MFS superfamily sulfate permease-like transporter
MSRVKDDDGFQGNKGTTQTITDLVKANYIPGITVALVSLPLSTALAIASGA